MGLITVYRPDEPSPPPTSVQVVSRRRVEHPAIGLVDNGKPHARRVLELLASELHARLGAGKVELVRKPSAAYTITSEQAEDLAERADIVITGVGDCGSCSSCSLHDAILLEQAGVPATVVITEPFQGVISSHAARLGAPGYHALVVPHPIWSRDETGMTELVRHIADQAVAQLTANASLEGTSQAASVGRV